LLGLGGDGEIAERLEQRAEDFSALGGAPLEYEG
jgi:hypothetical protein